MIIKIICIIYNRFKIITYKLYLIIAQYSCFLTSMALITCIYFFLSLPKVTVCNHKLAFNINITYLAEDFHKYKSIRKIQLKNCNSTFIKSVLLKNKYLFNINLINNLEINNRIEKLKKYGFLKRVKLSYITSSNIKYITLDFTFNPILKRVKILKQKKLLVPKYVLINTFYKHIGISKNYIEINESIQNIYQWYQSRGFNWVDIQLIETRKFEEICLQICEGKIATISIACRQFHLLSKTIMLDKEKEIINTLGFTKGKTINIKQIKSGIKKLKNSKTLNNCTYVIKRDTSGLNIFFEYNVSQSNSGFFFQEVTNINFYSQIAKICSYYSSQNKLCLLKIHKGIYSNHYKNISSTYDLYKPLILQIKEIIKYGIKPFLKNLILKYNLHKVSHYNNSYTIDIKISKDSACLNILFFFPNIKLNNYSMGQTSLNFYSKYYKYNLLQSIQKLQLLNFYLSQKNLGYAKTLFLGFNISLEKSINQYMYTKIKLITQFNKARKKFINISQYNNSNYCINNTVNTKLVNMFSQHITAKIKQKLMIFKIVIKHNTLYLTEQIQSGLLYKIESTCSIPLFIDTSFNTFKIQSSSHSLQFRYNQLYVFPKILQSIYTHILLLMIKIEWSINNKICKSMLYKDHTNIFFNKSNINNDLDQTLWLYHGEYSIYIFHHLSLYVFCNFTQNLSLYKKIKLSFINQYSVFNNSSIYEVNIGSGIQFNIPIYKMPTFRIEYKISNKNNYVLQLRLYSQYNN